MDCGFRGGSWTMQSGHLMSSFLHFQPRSQTNFSEEKQRAFQRRARLPGSSDYSRALVNLGKSVCTDCLLGLSFEVLQTAPPGPFL